MAGGSRFKSAAGKLLMEEDKNFAWHKIKNGPDCVLCCVCLAEFNVRVVSATLISSWVALWPCGTAWFSLVLCH